MTITEYLNNPMGKGNAIQSSSHKDQYINEYRAKEHLIQMKIYTTPTGIRVIHIKIPTTKDPSKFYDVVFELSKGNSDWLNSSMKVFSNSPSFVFTYAKAFDKQNLLIEWLKSKLDKGFLKQDSASRNPYAIVGYEKSLYIASLYVMNQFKHNSGKFTKPSISSLNTIKNYIIPMEKIMEYSKPKKELEIKKNKDNKKFIENIRDENVTGRVNKVKKVKNIESNNSIKKTKKTKKI